MNKLLLATALILSCSAPALAAYGSAHEPQYHRTEMRIQHSRGEPRTPRGEAADPYWSPCDYSTNWGPDACG